MRGKSVFFWLLRDSPEAFEVILLVILTIIQTLTAHHSGLFPDCVQMWRCHVLLLSKMGSSFAVLAAKLQHFAGVERQKRGEGGKGGGRGRNEHVPLTTCYNTLQHVTRSVFDWITALHKFTITSVYRNAISKSRWGRQTRPLSAAN